MFFYERLMDSVKIVKQVAPWARRHAILHVLFVRRYAWRLALTAQSEISDKGELCLSEASNQAPEMSQ